MLRLLKSSVIKASQDKHVESIKQINTNSHKLTIYPTGCCEDIILQNTIEIWPNFSYQIPTKGNHACKDIKLTFEVGSFESPLPMRCECHPCIARAAASLRARPDPDPGVPPALGYNNTNTNVKFLSKSAQHSLSMLRVKQLGFILKWEIP